MTDQHRREQIRQIASATDEELRALRGQLFGAPEDTDKPTEPTAPDDDKAALRDFAANLFER